MQQSKIKSKQNGNRGGARLNKGSEVLLASLPVVHRVVGNNAVISFWADTLHSALNLAWLAVLPLISTIAG